MTLFVNHTRRSYDGALADLRACRQFRHLDEIHRQQTVDGTGRHIVESRTAWSLKHPDPDKRCIKCGEPRSVYSTAVLGLCRPCYMSNLVDFWIEDVFTAGVKLFGLTCDCCGSIFRVKEDECKPAAIHCLENIDGRVKPVLCPTCAQDFKAFATRNYRRAWRQLPPRDLEKVYLAWLAQKLKVLADKVWRAA